LVNVEEWMDIRALRQQGHSIKQIVVMTSRSRNTVRKALRQKVPQQVIKRERSSKLDCFKEYICQRP
jgi:transposase